MSYCHKRGKSASDIDDFCGHCGAKLKEFIERAERSVEHSVRKSRKGLFVFIIFLVIVGYVILDLWAMTQLRPVWSADSIATTVSNLQANAGLTSATLSTTFRLENPTFVPVIAGRTVWDVNYGSTKIVDGKTGWVIMAPYSEKDIPAEAKVSYIGAGWSILKGIKNFFFGGNDKLNANAYMDIGVTKFKMAGLGE